MKKNPVAIAMVILLVLGFTVAGFVASSLNQKPTRSFAGGTVTFVRQEDGTTRYTLEGCKLQYREEALLDLLSGSQVTQITLRRCALSVEAVDVLISLSTLKAVTVESPTIEQEFQWLLFSEFAGLKKLTLLDCEIDNANLTQLHKLMTGCQVVPSAAGKPNDLSGKP